MAWCSCSMRSIFLYHSFGECFILAPINCTQNGLNNQPHLIGSSGWSSLSQQSLSHNPMEHSKPVRSRCDKQGVSHTQAFWAQVQHQVYWTFEFTYFPCNFLFLYYFFLQFECFHVSIFLHKLARKVKCKFSVASPSLLVRLIKIDNVMILLCKQINVNHWCSVLSL